MLGMPFKDVVKCLRQIENMNFARSGAKKAVTLEGIFSAVRSSSLASNLSCREGFTVKIDKLPSCALPAIVESFCGQDITYIPVVIGHHWWLYTMTKEDGGKSSYNWKKAKRGELADIIIRSMYSFEHVWSFVSLQTSKHGLCLP